MYANCLETRSVQNTHTKVDDNICFLSFDKKKTSVLPIPLLLSREVELEAESLLDGFSMIREFDKLSFLVKLEMVRNLDWTEGT